ncbi:MAG: (Fe-S)-binding protein [Pseudomonadota bacterium]
MKLDTPRIRDIIARHHLHMCLECGKCSSSCPRFVSGKEYSPRMLASKLLAGQPQDQAYIENSVWDCLTCGQCSERCPSGVEFVQMILDMRTELAASQGLMGYRTHDGALHSWMRIMTSPEISQNRTQWIGPELKVRRQGRQAFFVGCAPYFDVFFAGLGVQTLDIAKDSIRLINRLGIEPVVLSQERCCGHDLLWSGDRENFETLCRLNYQEFKAAGVEEVIVSCPECYSVLSHYLPRVVEGCELKVTLLIDLVRRAAQAGTLEFSPLARRVTYQDPCRLGRQAGCLDPPRQLLEGIPGLELAEMADHGLGALCCGNNAFINCDAYSKRHQIERLKQARDTGADLLVTACPKCMIHLTCAMKDPCQEGPLAMEVRDLASLLADHIR